MSGWPTARLKYCAELNRSELPEDTDPDFLFRYIDIGSVGHGRLISPPQVLRFAEAPSRARRIASVNDTIVSTVRTYLRATMMIGCEQEGAIVSTGFAVLTPHQTVLEPRYLARVVGSDPFIEEVVARSVGVSYPAINPSDLGDLRIPIPPLDTQLAIADYLDSESAHIDALVAAKSQLICLLEECYQAHHDGCFRELNAPQASLARFTTSITQGVSPQAENRLAEADEWGLLKLSAVKQGRFIPTENKALPPDYEIDPSLIPRAGDLLVTRSNTPHYVGDTCAVVGDPGQVMLCDLIYRIRLDRRLTPDFAAAALLRTESRQHLSSIARGTSQSMVKLRGEDVKAVLVPIAELGTQARVVSQLRSIRLRVDAAASALNRQIALLQDRRQALIAAAVTGELDIPTASA